MDMEFRAPPLDMAYTGTDPEMTAAPEEGEPAPPHEYGRHEREEADDPHRLTFYTQSRLAALSAFEEVVRGADHDLQHLNDILVRQNAAHHSTREFLNTMHAGIHRANELELSNSSLLSENRKLHQQLDQALKLRGQHETLLETYKRREAKLVQDNEQLLLELENTRQEASDAVATIAIIEAERSDLVGELAVKSSNAERVARENEILREKQINFSLELEHSLRRYTEVERKYEELSAIHKGETLQISELQAKLARAEKESYRVQKLADTAQLKLSEMEDALAAAEADLGEIDKRHADELHTLKALNDAMQGRLDATSKAQLRASNELGELKLKLADAVSDRKALEDRLSMLSRDHESDKRALSASVSQTSQLTVQQQSDSILLEVHAQEAEELRREIAAAKATIAKLNAEKRVAGGRPQGRRAKAPKRPDARAAAVDAGAKKSA
jgi:hypothetical protein